MGTARLQCSRASSPRVHPAFPATGVTCPSAPFVTSAIWRPSGDTAIGLDKQVERIAGRLPHAEHRCQCGRRAPTFHVPFMRGSKCATGCDRAGERSPLAGAIHLRLDVAISAPLAVDAAANDRDCVPHSPASPRSPAVRPQCRGAVLPGPSSDTVARAARPLGGADDFTAAPSRVLCCRTLAIDVRGCPAIERLASGR